MAQTQQPMGLSGNPMTAALLGPDILARQLRMQQNQQTAQQMIEQGQQVPQGQMVSGHFVAPSWSQYLANGLKGYMGRKIANDLPNQVASLGQAQMQGVNNLFGVPSAAQPQASASSQAPQDPTSPQSFPVGAPGQPVAAQPSGVQPSGQPTPQALGSALDGGTQNSASPQNQAMAGALGGSSGQFQMPGIPGMSRQQQAMLASQIGIPEYLKLAVQQGTPTDIQKNLIAQGVIPGSPEWNQALSGNVTKSNYIAPTSVAPGGTLIDPNTRQPVFNAPQNGIQTQYGPNGEATAAAVPGYSDANAGIQGAEAGAIEGAKAKLNLVSVPNGNGGIDLMPQDQAAERLRNISGQEASQSPNQPTGVLGRTLSPQVIAARKDLPQVTANIDTMIRTIDAALASPGKSWAVGVGSWAPTIPNTEQANFRAVNDQLKGQVFLQAYQTLKGGGQITEVEGKKAENAIARLGTAQTVKAYDEALNELKGVLSNSRNRAYEQAGMSVPAAKEAPTTAAPKKPEFDRSALEAEARKRGLIK